MIDAGGVIYVIGGGNWGGEAFNDVWVSKDGGADRTRGDSAGTQRVLKGYSGVLEDTFGVVRCTNVGVNSWVLRSALVYSRGA